MRIKVFASVVGVLAIRIRPTGIDKISTSNKLLDLMLALSEFLVIIINRTIKLKYEIVGIATGRPE